MPEEDRRISLDEMPEQTRKALSWLKEAYGVDYIYRKSDTLVLPRGKWVRVVVLSPTVYLEERDYGDGPQKVPYIQVKFLDGIYKLRLPKSLAMKFASIMYEVLNSPHYRPTIRGLVLRIRRPTGEGDDRYYSVVLEGQLDENEIANADVDYYCTDLIENAEPGELSGSEEAFA